MGEPNSASNMIKLLYIENDRRKAKLIQGDVCHMCRRGAEAKIARLLKVGLSWITRC